MKRIILFIIYVTLALIVGRNLTFLPKFDFINKQDKTNSLKHGIQEIISPQKGNYSVYFADLNSQDNFGINENQVYKGASLNKVHIVAVLYQLANKGKIDLNEKITIQENDIQDYGTGNLRYEEPGSVYSLKTLAKLALEKSDNTAAYIIAGKIGMDNVQKTIESWGLKQTDMKNNTTSLLDLYILFKKIYRKEITNTALTKEILDFLKDTDIEDRLPMLLPEKVNVYHKTGDGIGSIHDVGIIEKGKSIFFLGVMTSDIGDKENETKRTISQIAKNVFDFKINNE